MKKMMSLALALMLVVAMAACGGSKQEAAANFEVSSALELLETVWESIPEENRFPVSGGDYDNNVMGAPGAFDHENTEYMDNLLAVPADAAAMVDDAASMLHMMNANTFTSGVFHLADPADTDAFVAAVQETVANRQWVCGFPQQLLMVTDGNGYVVMAFGNAELLELFQSHVTALGGVVAVNESLL